jgi:hypothetical protein
MELEVGDGEVFKDTTREAWKEWSAKSAENPHDIQTGFSYIAGRQASHRCTKLIGKKPRVRRPCT